MNEELKKFFEDQLESWELAKRNYEALDMVKKKPFQVKDLKGIVQFNPARAVSTLAKVDEASIKKRDCFLCEKHRPKEQASLNILPGWELLVNPYPILPYHFTIASKEHEPQEVKIKVGEELAGKLEGMVVFYNDAGAGASAPDHAHFQAVPKTTLPLITLLDEKDGEGIEILQLPYQVIMNPQEIAMNKNPWNLFFWKDNRGEIKTVGISRKAHRPREYYLEKPERRSVSPGAIDMAGIIVIPFEEDFEAISNEDIENIYTQVS